MLEYQRYWTIEECETGYEVRFDGRVIAITDSLDFALAIVQGQ